MQSIMTFVLPLLAVGAPRYLDDQFDMPPGFRIYRAAARDLCGGSYDITFDGQARLLIGDGKQVRRLTDDNGDGVYDRFEVIAGGLGGRGPQGLLVYGDRLYAVGGDGIQLFTGYEGGGKLTHRGRIGEPFRTGGDHDAHTILRGHDGYLYFITGNGGGTKDRRHITEATSPALVERECAVFRISPDGKRWECVGSGGRNAPNLGMNYLGELFSLDSDMEWHVDLPWWRPVRLHHWIAGGDQGWQNVGAYPSYSIDNLPGIYNVGRGSPDWGVVYEHTHLPAKYYDAYLVCDYMSKSATTGGYNTVGRLFAFFLSRTGAGWNADMQVLARPKPGAKDADGNRISFGLVDIAVAPDGSLFLSDRNQGVWRIVYDPDRRLADGQAPPISPPWPAADKDTRTLVDALLTLPQPAAEWSRLREVELRRSLGADAPRLLRNIAGDPDENLRRRLRALRLLAPQWRELPAAFVERLVADTTAELRGQAAWLLGLRNTDADATLLATRLLNDEDPFVRRRAAEALSRCAAALPERYVGGLVERLADSDRLVRYAAMIALAHQPTDRWLEAALTNDNPQVPLRALIAADDAGQPAPNAKLYAVVDSLLGSASSRENRLDLLRILGRFRHAIQENAQVTSRVTAHLLTRFPDADRDLRWEQARLLGEYRHAPAFGKLLAALADEKDPTTQFHLAQAIARLPAGWNAEQERRAVGWFLSTQRGWFSEFGGKGLQFPQFWATVLTEFARHHRKALLAHLHAVDLTSQLGAVALDALSASDGAGPALTKLYRARTGAEVRRRLLAAFGQVRDGKVAGLLREEYLRLTDGGLRSAALRSLARQAPAAENRSLLEEGLVSDNVDTARACAQGLSHYDLEPTQQLTRILMSRMQQRREVFHAAEKLLAGVTETRRPGFNPRANQRRNPRDQEFNDGIAFWKDWYAKRFGQPFEPLRAEAVKERSDKELHAFLLSDAVRGGDTDRGRAVFKAARCAECHAGLPDIPDAKIFGPDLTAVTQRLESEEIADSLVYPSKLVADRFKAMVIQLDTGLPITGFITEQTDDAVTLVDQERVHRIPRDRIEQMAPQSVSLMPERLLNRLSDDQIRDLMAYLAQVGARSPKVVPAPKRR